MKKMLPLLIGLLLVGAAAVHVTLSDSKPASKSLTSSNSDTITGYYRWNAMSAASIAVTATASTWKFTNTASIASVSIADGQYLVILVPSGYTLKTATQMGLDFTGYDVHEVYEMTERGNALILQDTISEDMIPNGIAVYRALDTELNNLGDLGQLSPDGTHTQEGLPCLLQTYVTLCWLFDRLRINKSIYGHPMRMTTAIYNTISVPGANLGTGVVQGTDAQYLLAQEVAIKAYKEGKQFVTRNLYPYEWGGGSALIQCTFSITTNISGATIKINGIEQSSVVVLGGSTVNWEVSKDGYETQRGSETIGSDTTRSVELMPIVSVTSISAEFNQGERTIFDEQDLDDLREYLVVHVNYNDGTRKETDAYTLSGTLTDGANTITVSFGGKETTFIVEVRSVVIPEGVTRYGWVAYYKDSSPASSELKTPSNFIYLNAYEDMNELSAEFTIGKKPNVNVVSGPALLGARLSSSSNTRPWYGIYVPAELGGLRVDIRNHAGAEFIPWPSDVNKFKLVIDNRSTSPARRLRFRKW